MTRSTNNGRHIRQLLQKQMTRQEFLGLGIFAVGTIFGVTGVIRELLTHAATPHVSLEPETGTVTAPATSVADSTASGGKSVIYGAAPTPQPTPAPTPSPIPGFTAFVPGTIKPIGLSDAGTRNVGPRIAESAMTVYNGDITLTPTSVISGLIINGKVTGRGGTVTDCIIKGHNKPASQDAMAVGTAYDFGGAVFAWCRFDGTGRESGFNDCIEGGNYTVRYSELTGGVDGIGANTVGNATIECCRIGNGYYMSWWNDATNAVRTTSYTDAGGVVHNPPFPNQPSGDTHSDGMQIQGNAGWVVRGCFIGGGRITTAAAGKLDPTLPADYKIMSDLNNGQDFVTSCLMINAVAAKPVGALIEKNWLEGGAARVNMSTAGTDLLQGVTVRNNRFIRSSWGGGGGFYIYAFSNHKALLSGNIFDDTGAAVPVVLH